MSLRSCHEPGRAGLRRGLRAALLSVAAVLLAGCAVFPQGSYWRTRESPKPQGAPAATRVAPAAAELQDAITQRWANEDLARAAQRMNGWAGRAVYADAMQVLVWCYVEPVTYRELVVAGLESLRAALDNPTFRVRFPASEAPARRATLAQALDILILKARAADPWFACQAADWLAVAMEKNLAFLGLPDGAVVAEFLFGAMDRLDPYTRFMTTEMLREYEEQSRGVYVGIGAEIADRDGRFFLAHVFEGGAAARAGLVAGDEITDVEGTGVAGLSLSELGRRLRGKAGTTVTVTIRPRGEGEPRQVRLERKIVRVPPIRDAQMLDEPHGVGYVRLTGFTPGAEGQLRKALAVLTAQGAKALVLDLRDNPGGSLDEAVGVAGVFLAGGRVAQMRGRMLGATWTYGVPFLSRPAWRGPLVVLVNEHTASAAELAASALQDRAGATVVGRRTFGKGAVQICWPVDWGTSAVCLTIARLYDEQGRCLDGRGVEPSRDVPESSAPAAALRDDPAVRAALDVLRAGAPQGASTSSSGAKREIFFKNGALDDR
ncbi:MAG TPA: S41 family peptidase [Phycisphaerae bacterium]|nr:S41 family peptidase [Phycisphaerae bacterium]